MVKQVESLQICHAMIMALSYVTSGSDLVWPLTLAIWNMFTYVASDGAHLRCCVYSQFYSYIVTDEGTGFPWCITILFQ